MEAELQLENQKNVFQLKLQSLEKKLVSFSLSDLLQISVLEEKLVLLIQQHDYFNNKK